MGVSPLFAPLSTLSSFIAFSASRIAPPRMPGVRKKRDRAEDPDRQERKKQRLLAQEGSVSCRTRSSMAKLNPTVTTRTIAGVQYTYINGSEQSAMHTDSLRSYDYLAIITQCLTQTDAQGMTVLLLGVAGGVLCRQWEAYFPEAIQQVVCYALCTHSALAPLSPAPCGHVPVEIAMALLICFFCGWVAKVASV